MSSESKIDEKNNNSEIKSKNNEEEVKKEEESVIKSPIQSKKRSGSPVQPTEKEIAAKAKELAAKAAFDASEIIRLSKLIDQYEKENFRLRKELEFSHNAQKANMDKMRDQELIRQGLAKQIKSLESTIKFDRIATDGLTKKVTRNLFRFFNYIINQIHVILYVFECNFNFLIIDIYLHRLVHLILNLLMRK